MLAIDNQPVKGAPVFERRRDRPRIARRHRPHRVEQMGEAGQPVRQRRTRLIVARHRMAERDPDASLHQTFDKAGGHPFGRQRHQRHAAMARRQQVDIRRGRRSQHRFGMHTAALG